jgi:hypothetical protein
VRPSIAVLEAEHGWRFACFTWAALHIVLGLPLNLLLPGLGIPPGSDATLPQASVSVSTPA